MSHDASDLVVRQEGGQAFGFRPDSGASLAPLVGGRNPEVPGPL